MLKINDNINIMIQTANKYNIVQELQNYMFPKLIKETILVPKKTATSGPVRKL